MCFKRCKKLQSACLGSSRLFHVARISARGVLVATVSDFLIHRMIVWSVVRDLAEALFTEGVERKDAVNIGGGKEQADDKDK